MMRKLLLPSSDGVAVVAVAAALLSTTTFQSTKVNLAEFSVDEAKQLVKRRGKWSVVGCGYEVV